MTQNPTQIRNDELDQWRHTVIADLRDLIALLSTTTRDQIPTPDIYVSVYSVEAPTDDDPYAYAQLTPEHVRAAMAASPGHWRKASYENQITYTKDIGEAVRYRFHVSRATTCQQVQVGTKTVEAVPEHEVPVYEWRCDTPELEV